MPVVPCFAVQSGNVSQASVTSRFLLNSTQFVTKLQIDTRI